MSKHKHIFLLRQEAYLPGGYASYLMQKKQYEIASGEHYLIRLLFRDIFLKRYEQAYGILWCTYCPRKNLNIEGENKLSTTATLEHITPLANGGDYYDLKNITIACSKCNSRRGSKKLNPEQAARLEHRRAVEQRLLRLRDTVHPKISQIRTDFMSMDRKIGRA